MIQHVLTPGPDGLSRFHEEAIALTPRDFAPPAGPIAASDGVPAETLLFLELPAGWNDPAHPSPRRQTLLVLSGTAIITPGEGPPLTLAPGDIWRMEDTTGGGHHTRVTEDGPFRAAVVQLG